MLSFKPTFSLSSFTFIKRLLSFSSLSAIRVVSSAYLRLLIFLPAIFIPAYASSSLTFHMMCITYKLISRVTIYSTLSVILESKKRKSVTVSIFSLSICHEVMGPDAIILVFLMLNFTSAFSLSSSPSSRGSLVPLHFLTL